MLLTLSLRLLYCQVILLSTVSPSHATVQGDISRGILLNCRRLLNYRNLSVCSTLQQGLGCNIHIVMVTVTAYQEC